MFGVLGGDDSTAGAVG